MACASLSRGGTRPYLGLRLFVQQSDGGPEDCVEFWEELAPAVD